MKIDAFTPVGDSLAKFVILLLDTGSMLLRLIKAKRTIDAPFLNDGNPAAATTGWTRHVGHGMLDMANEKL